MKFTAVKSKLLDGLRKVLNVTPAKASDQQYTMVLICATDGRIDLVATDGVMSMRALVSCDVQEQGTVSIPLRLFYSIVSVQQEGDISVVEDKSHVRVKSGNSVYKIGKSDPSLFPKLPSDKGDIEFVVPVAGAKDLFKKTSFAQSSDDTRKTLKSTLIELLEDKIRCVATDGRRLAMAEYEGEFGKTENAKIVIPASAVSVLQKLLDGDGACAFRATKTQLFVAIENEEVEFRTSLVDGMYPNYLQVIPVEHSATAVIDRTLLLDSITRMSVIPNSTQLAVNLKFLDGRLIITNRGDGSSGSTDEIPMKYDGSEIETMFDPRYITDALKAMNSDDVVVELTQGDKQTCLKSGSERYLYVLMPLRLN